MKEAVTNILLGLVIVLGACAVGWLMITFESVQVILFVLIFIVVCYAIGSAFRS